MRFVVLILLALLFCSSALYAQQPQRPSASVGVTIQAGTPTVDDDSGDGYAVGTKWIVSDGSAIYEAVDVTAAAAVWRQTYPAVETQDFDDVADLDPKTTGRNSFANALRIEGTTANTGIAVYQSDTTGANWNCYVSSTENDCDYYRQLNDGKKFGVKDAAGNVEFEHTEDTGITALTANVETSGVTLTTVSYIQIDFASCIAATAANAWDDAGDGATAPTAACNDTGSIQRPSADFSGSAVNSVERTIALPPDWTGNIDMTIRYASVAASPTGNVEFDISTVCRAAGETWDASFNAAQTITDAVAAQNVLNDATQTTLTVTGCAAGEDMTIRVSRDGTNDTNNDLAKALWARLTLRRAQ